MMIDPQGLQRLQAIGLTPAQWRHLETVPTPAQAPFVLRVSGVERDACRLHDGQREHLARAHPACVAEGGLVVGDWAFAERDRHGQWWVHGVAPPLSELARRIHDGRGHVTRVPLVSNVDTALIVMGLDGDFNLRRMERYLALARLSGLAAVVVLTKADLCEPAFAEARLRQVCELLPPGADALALDARGDEAAQALAPWLAPAQTLVLLGSSGAGKSTLTNALLGQAVQGTGPSRLADARGRHTTTSRSLHALPGGACVIDTPGLRTLRLDGDERALHGVFDDIGRLSMRCRFADCRHRDEPGCAVRGEVDPLRLRNFHKLQREARRDTLSVLERRAERQRWKIRARAARARDAEA